jgi:UDP-N-acetylglucosamine 1-carboxyvinyltransferase
VAQLQRILGNHGVDIMSAGKRPGDHEYQGQTLHISAANIIDTTAPYELVSRMRASFWVIAPLLARMHEAKVSLPGGCAIGTRPVDLLIMALEKLGAEIAIDGGYVVAKAPGGLKGATIDFPKVTVSGTHVALMAATLAKGTTVITNAACEPHVQEFCGFLEKMGARLEGVGGSRIVVEGVSSLSGAEFTFADDFHEVATFLAMGAMTGGDIAVKNGSVDQFPLLDRTFAKFGVEITHKDGWSRAKVDGTMRVRQPFTSNILQKVEAAPWPYVPADLLPIFVALGVRAEGQCMFWNKVYEGALGWSSELGKFGAHSLLCDPHRLITFGGKPLVPAEVESPYIIRVAIALFMLAASIEGESTILNAAPIQRAHPKFVENLNALGADVSWVKGD